MTGGDVLQNAGKRPDFNGMMGRNHLVIFAVTLRRYANVGAGLACDFVTQPLEGLRQLQSIYITRQLHWPALLRAQNAGG